MTGTRNSQRKAVQGGARGEGIIRRTYKTPVDGVKRKQARELQQRHDGRYKNRNLEVKSCEKTVRAGNSERVGRFWFRRDQLRALRKENGYVALVVRDGTNPRKSLTQVVRARDLPMRSERAWTLSHAQVVDPAKAIRGRFRDPNAPASWTRRIGRALGLSTTAG